jgi:hypothetical protein
MGGCSRIYADIGASRLQPDPEKHPDVKYKVDTAMTQNSLGVVKVSQDQDKGVIR